MAGAAPGNSADFCVVGGGIVGAATALALIDRHPGARVALFEKEGRPAAHQTGRNSGVIHSGIYYQPGSLKARLCREGERATKAFCDAHGIAYRTVGKLVVATDEAEIPRLRALADNAGVNGIDVDWIDGDEIRRREPAVTGIAAIDVSVSGIVDYAAVTRAMLDRLHASGGAVLLGTQVNSAREQDGGVMLETSAGPWRAGHAVICAGIDADRFATRSGLTPDFRMVPFRGDYYALPPERSGLVRRMIYPVPDPALPFLGVHLTPMIDGALTVGPNAVLSFAREGYGRFAIDPRDAVSAVGYSGLWRLLGQHWRSALGEFGTAMSKRAYLERCRRYAPDLTLDDLRPYRSGIRAQAITPTGEMIHDFRFLRSERILHVVNAPSPAATSAIPIGRHIVATLLGEQDGQPDMLEAGNGR